jgi:hypothetical protein
MKYQIEADRKRHATSLPSYMHNEHGNVPIGSQVHPPLTCPPPSLCPLNDTGLQDSYLRTARELHDLDRLDDWVAYLRDTWAGPLYHDGFYDLALSLRNLLKRDEGQYTDFPKMCRGRGVR